MEIEKIASPLHTGAQTPSVRGRHTCHPTKTVPLIC